MDIFHTSKTILPLSPSQIILQNVLVVPQLKENRLSISQFRKGDACILNFLLFQDKGPEKETALARGSRRSDLYSLDLPNSTALFSRYPKKITKDVWHARLGHAQSKIFVFSTIRSWLM